MKVKDKAEKRAKDALIKAGIELLNREPEKNMDKLFALVRKTISKDEENLAIVNNIQYLYHNNPNIRCYIKGIIKETNKNCREKFFTNFLANAVWYGMPKRDRIYDEKDIKVPFAILMSPSMRCNLTCKGCYAASYSKEDDIPREEADRIIAEARELGIYYFVILGGEPFINQYLVDLFQKYNDMIFMPFTNGTLIDETMANTLAELGNVIPMLSLEGFQQETDERRGKGVFDKVMNAMDLLRERGILFGVSTAVEAHNAEIVTTSSFIDMLIEKGSKMSWYFIYMPVGKDPDIDYMLTPGQRISLGKSIREIRKTKPYFAIDFFNDAPVVGGCIAGKFYCHINSKEDVEPCIFAHFATTNLKGKSLMEAFDSDFFRELRHLQPYNKNLLKPCMMIDNPQVIRDVALKTEARPTDEGADMMLNDPDFQRKLDAVAKEYAPYADKAWIEDFNSTGNYKMSRR